MFPLFTLHTVAGLPVVTVDVSPSNTISHMPCGVIRKSFIPGNINYIKCAPGSEGRFVTVTSVGINQMLSLSEVQVYGDEGMFVPPYVPVCSAIRT